MDTLGPLLVGGHASSAIIAGHYAGLWAVLHKSPGKTWGVEELADSADCKERWVREWVGVMASAGVITLNSDMTLCCRPDVVAALIPSAEPLSFFTSLELTFDKEEKIGKCFKKNGPLGVPYSDFPNFQKWMEDWTKSRIVEENFPTGYFETAGGNLYVAAEKGLEVLEPGCGAGRHTLAVAKHFPNSTFTAFDIDTEQIEKNKIKCKELGLKNVTFLVADFCAMPQEWNGRFDYLMIYDCMHDLPHPAQAMAGLKRVLKDDALVTMMDINTTSHMPTQVKDPMSAVEYNISLHHCMSVSLANGGVGLGSCWGVELAVSMLQDAGWAEDEIRVIKEEMHAIFVLTKGKGLQS